jgi:hypothetical protein
MIASERLSLAALPVAGERFILNNRDKKTAFSKIFRRIFGVGSVIFVKNQRKKKAVSNF